MPVLGIDLGTSSVVTGAAQKRGIDIILNEAANRRNPTCITFTACERNVGELAQTTAASNMQNHVTNIMRFIGRSYDARDVQDELRGVSFRHRRLPNGEVGVVVGGYDGAAETVFTFTQLLAMVLHKIQEDVEAFLGFGVPDVVIAVPSWFTQVQRKEVKAAAEIVEFAVLAIVPTHLAATVAYGLRRLGELKADEKAEVRTLLVDVGESTTTASLGAYTAGHFQVAAFACDRHLGGRDFDAAALAMILEQERLDLQAVNRRAQGRLLKAARQLKHVLSSNAEAPYNVEYVTEDRDIHGRILRSDFEARVAPLCDRVARVVERCIRNAKGDASFGSVEIYGGGTRVPAVQQRVIETVQALQREAGVASPVAAVSKMLNADECVAYGAAMYGAFLSKGFKTPDIGVYDVPLYGVALVRPGVDGAQEETTLIYTTGTRIPSFMQTHYNCTLDPARPDANRLRLQLRYANAQSNAGSDPALSGENIFAHEPTVISDVVVDLSGVHTSVDDPELRGDAPDSQAVRVRVKVRCDREGVYSVSSVSYEEPYVEVIKEKVRRPQPTPAPAPEAEAKTEQGAETGEEMQAAAAEGADEAQPKADAKGEAKAKAKAEPEFDVVERKELRRRRTNIPFKEEQVGIKADDVRFMREQELKMRLTDVRVKALKEARNDLETLLYTAKDAMAYKLASTMPDDAKATLAAEIEKVEAWLYSDAADAAQAQDFRAHHDAVSKILAPYERIHAAHAALDEAGAVVARLADADELKLLDSADAKYAHIPRAARDEVKARAAELRTRLEAALADRFSYDPAKMPPVTLEGIRRDVDAVLADAAKLMATPKPAPKKEKKDKKKDKKKAKDAAEKGAEPTPRDEEMKEASPAPQDAQQAPSKPSSPVVNDLD